MRNMHSWFCDRMRVGKVTQVYGGKKDAGKTLQECRVKYLCAIKGKWKFPYDKRMA